MARIKKTVAVEKDGRDKDKLFEITEMSAWDTNQWGIRCAKQLAKSGIDLPQEIVDLGIAGVVSTFKKSLISKSKEADEYGSSFVKAFMVLAAGVEEEKLFILLNDLLSCVKFKNKKGDAMDLLIDEHIEDSSTLNLLYSEVFQLHNFF